MDTCVEGGLEAMASGRGQPANIYLRYACTRSNAEGCFHLGQFHSMGNPSVKAQKIAQKAFAQACFRGNLEGCVTFLRTADPPGSEREKTLQVLELNEIACQLAVKAGQHKRVRSYCATAGHQAHKDSKAPQDVAFAVTLLRPACVAGAEDTCETLLRLFARENALQKDRKIIELHRDVCHARQASLWPQYCHRVSKMTSLGQGTKPDLEIAAEYRDRACQAGLSAACAEFPAKQADIK